MTRIHISSQWYPTEPLSSAQHHCTIQTGQALESCALSTDWVLQIPKASAGGQRQQMFSVSHLLLPPPSLPASTQHPGCLPDCTVLLTCTAILPWPCCLPHELRSLRMSPHTTTRARSFSLNKGPWTLFCNRLWTLSQQLLGLVHLSTTWPWLLSLVAQW